MFQNSILSGVLYLEGIDFIGVSTTSLIYYKEIDILLNSEWDISPSEIHDLYKIRTQKYHWEFSQFFKTFDQQYM